MPGFRMEPRPSRPLLHTLGRWRQGFLLTTVRRQPLRREVTGYRQLSSIPISRSETHWISEALLPFPSKLSTQEPRPSDIGTKETERKIKDIVARRLSETSGQTEGRWAEEEEE